MDSSKGSTRKTPSFMLLIEHEAGAVSLLIATQEMMPSHLYKRYRNTLKGKRGTATG